MGMGTGAMVRSAGDEDKGELEKEEGEMSLLRGGRGEVFSFLIAIRRRRKNFPAFRVGPSLDPLFGELWKHRLQEYFYC